jgi:hypothetical protein
VEIKSKGKRTAEFLSPTDNKRGHGGIGAEQVAEAAHQRPSGTVPGSSLSKAPSPPLQLSKQLDYLFSISLTYWAFLTKFTYCTFLEDFNNLPIRKTSLFLLV